jgi:UDP-N-acetylglucosamine 2-epimerase (non-hydrolysing)
VGDDTARLHEELIKILAGNAKNGTVPPLWDGRAGERIADIVVAGPASWARINTSFRTVE